MIGPLAGSIPIHLPLYVFFGCFEQNIVVGAGGANLCSAALFGFLIEWGLGEIINFDTSPKRNTRNETAQNGTNTAQNGTETVQFVCTLLKVESGKQTHEANFSRRPEIS